ncbi:MAG TPA: right-handed parallel beta-helix repeat-containing protein [Candidatus Saccharimonadales bacterium]|nr:right-handed parallel beta-helix repeat-containing protein [Candidatus Saccharimonadales bacterium]
MIKNKNGKRRTFRRNLKPTMVIIFIPVLLAMFVFYYIFSDSFKAYLAQRGSERLITENWPVARDTLAAEQPNYEPKNAYYKMKERQDLTWAAEHFGVSLAELKKLNPGSIVYGTTIIVPPVQKPLSEEPNLSNSLGRAQVRVDKNGFIQVVNEFSNEEINLTVPKLASLLASQNAIEKVGDKHYRVLKPIYLLDNFRLDITSDTVEKLELYSGPDFDTTCLCFENSAILIKDVEITSYDPSTKGPDTEHKDGRSFIRALKSSRMDVLNSRITYLGEGLYDKNNRKPIMENGGTYGISWRIPDGTLGSEIATGWVENSTFEKNHFGAYTFGVSGMMWRGNTFVHNDVYGLDPHDDSNSATVVNNKFLENGKHGFIVSKRCNFNVIRNNISSGNKLHGFMLHQDSVHNLIENNIAERNTDNFVIYASSFNAIRDNKSYDASGSHVRINESSKQNYVINNEFHGGNKGVYIYGNSLNVLVVGNKFANNKEAVVTRGARNVIIVDNFIRRVSYNISPGDRVIFGPNDVNRSLQ